MKAKDTIQEETDDRRAVEKIGRLIHQEIKEQEVGKTPTETLIPLDGMVVGVVVRIFPMRVDPSPFLLQKL